MGHRPAGWAICLYTDSAAVYNFALDAQMSLKHRAVNYSKEWVVPNTRIYTDTVESSFSLLKRGLIASIAYRSSTCTAI
jgi:hypothetical protein